MVIGADETDLADVECEIHGAEALALELQRLERTGGQLEGHEGALGRREAPDQHHLTVLLERFAECVLRAGKKETEIQTQSEIPERTLRSIMVFASEKDGTPVQRHTAPGAI